MWKKEGKGKPVQKRSSTPGELVPNWVLAKRDSRTAKKRSPVYRRGLDSPEGGGNPGSQKKHIKKL